jgi:hypothetical protein
MVENRLRIFVASNNDWAVPAGIGDRRWFVLNVADTYAGTGHRDYWNALYAEIGNGGEAAMLYELLAMDLRGFDVRVIPHTAAKAQQQALSLRGTPAWLRHVLQEGAIETEWNTAGLTIRKDYAYNHYQEFSKQRREFHPEIKDLWAKKIRALLGACVSVKKQKTDKGRVRMFQFAPLADCRRQFASHLGAPDLKWEEPDNEPGSVSDVAVGQTAEDVGDPTDPDALHDAHVLEMEELELEPEPDYLPEYEPEDEGESD